MTVDLMALARELDAASPDSLTQVSIELLRRPLDWCSLAHEQLENMDDERLISGTREIFVDNVEPKTFLLYDNPERFRIVLNHFTRESFDAHRQGGRVTPHFHRFDFVTRILAGGYHHLLFDNSGGQLKPSLSLWHRTRDEVGHVYFLPWQEYHCVLAPTPDSLSLQIRGPVRYDEHRSVPKVSDDELLTARQAALAALAAARGTAPSDGQVPDFTFRWLRQASGASR